MGKMSYKQGQILELCATVHADHQHCWPVNDVTVQQKLVKISDLFWHNNGLRKRTINLPPITGPMPLFW